MPLFITFEGPDGSGKTTQVGLLADYLTGLGYDVLTTREPGGTRIGDRIRSLVLDVRHAEMTAEAEFLLYSASRAQLVREVIAPHLGRGGIVLSDRFADSSVAYQGYSRGLPLDAVHRITQFATGGLTPSLTVCLDLPVEIGIERKRVACAARGGEWNRLDRQGLDFHHRVREAYRKMAQAEPHRWLVIDAAQTIDHVHMVIRGRLEPVLSELRKVGNA